MLNDENSDKFFSEKKKAQRVTQFGQKANENKSKDNKNEYCGENYRKSKKKAPKKPQTVIKPQIRWTSIVLNDGDLERAFYVPKAKVKNLTKGKQKKKEIKEISPSDAGIPKRSSGSSSNNSTKSSSNKTFNSSKEDQDKDQMSTTLNSNEDNSGFPLNGSNRSSKVAFPIVGGFQKYIFQNWNPISGAIPKVQQPIEYQGRNIQYEKPKKKLAKNHPRAKGDLIHDSRKSSVAAFNKFSNASASHQNENTEILTVKVKLGECAEMKVFTLRKYDDLFMTVHRFCASNAISEKFITPFMSQVIQALNSIYKLFNITINEEEIYYLKRLMCTWKTSDMKDEIHAEEERCNEMCYTSFESEEEQLTDSRMLNKSV